MLTAMSARRVVVLLEGQSDVAAVRALLELSAASAPPGQVELVDMGGVTNIRRHLVDLAGGPAHHDGERPSVGRVLGLCDAGEASFFARALATVGQPVSSTAGMARLGFHVCTEDLEDELIRALGTERVVEVLGDLGLLDRFATFCRQPTWTGRPVADQLRRFAGTTSGRKVLVAQALASSMSPARVPPPLAALVEQVRAARSDPGPGPAVRPFAPQTLQG